MIFKIWSIIDTYPDTYPKLHEPEENAKQFGKRWPENFGPIRLFGGVLSSEELRREEDCGVKQQPGSEEVISFKVENEILKQFCQN